MPQAEKIVRYIAPKASVSEEVKNKYRQKTTRKDNDF